MSKALPYVCIALAYGYTGLLVLASIKGDWIGVGLSAWLVLCWAWLSWRADRDSRRTETRWWRGDVVANHTCAACGNDWVTRPQNEWNPTHCCYCGARFGGFSQGGAIYTLAGQLVEPKP